MKHCIGIIEVLVKTVIVETNETGEGSLQKAIDCAKREYDAQKIVLCADDLRPDPITGEPACIDEADWIDPEEVQKKEGLIAKVKSSAGINSTALSNLLFFSTF